MIDRHHRLLIELVNETDGAASSKNRRRVQHLLRMVRIASEDHFRQEDLVLWDIRTGAYARTTGNRPPKHAVVPMAASAFDEHLADHTSSLERFDEIAHSRVSTVGESLKAWFVDHVTKHDAQLRGIFQSVR